MKTLSQKGLELLKSLESCRLKPYDDQTGKEINGWCKGATIGWGHLISAFLWEEYKNGITQERADEILITDMRTTVDFVNRYVIAEQTQNQFDALVLLAFNIPRGYNSTDGFITSSVLKWINGDGIKANYPNLETSWKAWNKSQGKVMPGLIKRRDAEWVLYSTPEIST